MIRLKDRPNPPDNLLNQDVVDKLVAIRKKVKKGQKPTSKEFTKYWHPECRETLWKHQDEKCAYCERIRQLTRESDLEHFRPKAEVTDESAHFGYWWLAYDFNNYLYSCKPCNEDHKRNKFPVLGPRAFNEGESLEDEKAYYINPFDEYPEALIGYYYDGLKSKYVKMMSNLEDTDCRVDTMAIDIGLNRDSLMKERAALLLSLDGMVTALNYAIMRDSESLIEKSTKIIKAETSSKRQFAGFRRFYFKQAGLEEYIDSGTI